MTRQSRRLHHLLLAVAFSLGLLATVVASGMRATVAPQSSLHFLAGYLGPRAAIFVELWRPWRKGVRVEFWTTAVYGNSVSGKAFYTPLIATDEVLDRVGYETQPIYFTVARKNPFLPWEIVDLGLGP